MASFSLITKILSDFLSDFYSLNEVLKHETNYIHKRCASFEKSAIINVIELIIQYLSNLSQKYEMRNWKS